MSHKGVAALARLAQRDRFMPAQHALSGAAGHNDAPSADATETSAAIATPPGQGGVGIVRLSGPDAFAIGRALFRPGRQLSDATRNNDGVPSSHRLTYGHVVDPATGEVVDEVLAAFMRAPHT